MKTYEQLLEHHADKRRPDPEHERQLAAIRAEREQAWSTVVAEAQRYVGTGATRRYEG